MVKYIFLQSFKKTKMIRKMKKTVLFLTLNLIWIGLFAQAIKKPVTVTKPIETKPVTTTTSVPKNNPWVFTYGSDTVYRNEFERLLSKNRKDKAVPSDQEVAEYLELYQNFKMKVKEATMLQLDTSAAYKSELAGYRKQLANPYLTDKNVTAGLITEAYKRMLEEIKASHILINCSESASPKDTLEAYNKILELRKRLLKGESFDSVALQNSEDPSVKRNYGNLGWFTSFYMIYSFETQAYNTQKGQVSMPFRTRYGYHLVKVTDRRAARGEASCGHIMIQTGQSASAETVAEAKLKIDSVYQKLTQGESFESMVKQYSQDQSSAQNGGVITVGSLSSYPDIFKDVAFSTIIGDISKPFKSDFGWHILKVVDLKGIPPQKEVEEMIKSKIARDSRSESSKIVVAQRIKKENKYTEYPENIKAMVAKIDTTFLAGTWVADESKFSDKPVMSISNKKYSAKEFVGYLRVMQEPRKGGSVAMAVNSLLKKYSDEKALEYEESILDTKYEDFRNLMQEYHDGILLFDLTDKMVWTKAVNDTAGIEKFHDANKTKYMWKERVSFTRVTCIDDKTKKEAMKMAAAGKTKDDLKAKLNKKIEGSVTFVEVKAEKGENAEYDKLWDKSGVVDITDENGNHKFNIVHGIVGPEAKTTKEAKGAITSDYQIYLEKEWIKELRAKYPVTVNDATLKILFRNDDGSIRMPESKPSKYPELESTFDGDGEPNSKAPAKTTKPTKKAKK